MQKEQNISPSSRRPDVFSTGAWLHGEERGLLGTSSQSPTKTERHKQTWRKVKES